MRKTQKKEEEIVRKKWRNESNFPISPSIKERFTRGAACGECGLRNEKKRYGLLVTGYWVKDKDGIRNKKNDPKAKIRKEGAT